MTNKVRFFPYWPMTSIQYQYLLNKKISILSQKISKLGTKLLQGSNVFEGSKFCPNLGSFYAHNDQPIWAHMHIIGQSYIGISVIYRPINRHDQ